MERDLVSPVTHTASIHHVRLALRKWVENSWLWPNMERFLETIQHTAVTHTASIHRYDFCETFIVSVSWKLFDYRLTNRIWTDLVSPVTQAASIHHQGYDFCETFMEKWVENCLTVISADQKWGDFVSPATHTALIHRQGFGETFIGKVSWKLLDYGLS